MRALIPLKLRWVSQTAINGAFDEEALDLMKRSGCIGALIGFESLDPATLQQMNKGFNLMHGGPRGGCRQHAAALGSPSTERSSLATTTTPRRRCEAAVDFARQEGLFIAAFNHITPFPGTPLYGRLQARRAVVVRGLVERRTLSLQHGPFPAEDHGCNRTLAALHRGPPQFLLLVQHRPAGTAGSQSTRPLCDASLLDNQRHAPLGHLRSQRIAAGRRRLARAIEPNSRTAPHPQATPT